MGRGPGPVPLSEAGGAPDYVALMRELVKSHQTLKWQVLEDGWHLATWEEDDGEHREARRDLAELYGHVAGRPVR